MSNFFTKIGDKLKAVTKSVSQTLGYVSTLTRSSLFGFGGWDWKREDKEKIIQKTYIDNSNGYAVIKKLVETASSIPFVLKEFKKNGDVEIVEDLNNDLYALLMIWTVIMIPFY